MFKALFQPELKLVELVKPKLSLLELKLTDEFFSLCLPCRFRTNTHF